MNVFHNRLSPQSVISAEGDVHDFLNNGDSAEWRPNLRVERARVLDSGPHLIIRKTANLFNEKIQH